MTEEKKVGVVEVIRAVAQHTGVPISALKDPSNKRPDVVQARHVAIYLAYKATFQSREDIAKHFNFKGKGDTAVRYGYDRVEKALHNKRDRTIKEEVATVAGALGINLKTKEPKNGTV